MIEAKPLSSKELRQYGLMMGSVIAVLFGLLLPFVFNRPQRLWPWFVVTFFWGMALLFPKGLKQIYSLWMRFGHFMGRINSTLILSAVYSILFVPIALVFRLTGRDRLERRPEAKRESYRVKRSFLESESRMEKPF